MTLQTIPGMSMVTPPVPYFASNSISFSSILIDASTEKVAFIGNVANKDRASKNITKVGFRTGTVSLNASSTIKTSIQSVSTTASTPGEPTGTILGATNNGFVTEASSGFSSNSWHQTGALGETVTVSHGDLIAVVIEYGTFTAADACNISALQAPTGLHRAQTCLFTASWAVQSVSANVILEFDDGTFGTLGGAFPCSALTSIAYNANTAGADEYALEINVPFTCKIDGAFVAVIVGGSGADFDVVLYDGTTAVETRSIDASTLAAISGMRYLYIPFTQQRTLSANTTYRIAVKPTTGTNVTLQAFDVSASGHWQAHAMGASWVLGSRLDGGSWAAATATRRPLIAVCISALDDGAGSGGLAMPVSGRICA